MTSFTLFDASYKRIIYTVLLVIVLLLTIACSFRYATFLQGISLSQVKALDTDWYYEDGDNLHPLNQVPCQLEYASNTLNLVRDLSATMQNPDQLLAIQTRYQSIQVWADDTLIYEAAQGEDHALSSMWHFIPTDLYHSANTLRIQLTKYDSESSWQVFSILQDYPDVIQMYLVHYHVPNILVFICCIVITLLLLFGILFMTIHKIEGTSLVFSLAAFIFLSGMWILLDSKVTTIDGGNYALTYFFSYFVFYLLPVPLICFFQLLLQSKNRFLQALIWIAAGNAGLCMLLHLLGIVPIRNTAISIHIIIILFLSVFLWECIYKKKVHTEKHLAFSFWGILFIFITALVSIILYHANLLPLPTVRYFMPGDCLR